MFKILFVKFPVIREATTPGSRDEPTVAYTDCVQKHRRSITPTPFPEQALRQATSVHYSAIASSYLAVVRANNSN